MKTFISEYTLAMLEAVAGIGICAVVIKFMEALLAIA